MWKTVLACAVLIAATADLAAGQKCPYPWYGYTTDANSKCYHFVYNIKLTWSDAKDYCRTSGGDLLKVESTQEWTWISAQLKSISASSRTHLDHFPLWWAGLNNQEMLSYWTWADGSPANKYVVWRPGEPNNHNNSERCAEIMGYNQFNDDRCEYKYYFICNRPRSLPLACDSDLGWQPINGKCYRLYNWPNNWLQAKRQCSHDGGALAAIDSQAVEAPMHELAVVAKKPLWIGLHSQQTSTTTNTWVWTNGSQLTTSYWNVAPHVARNQLNTTCVYISNTLPIGKDWVAQSCTTNRGYICQKPQGVCFPGWVGHGAYCYQFDPQYRLNFVAATNLCSQQGAELLRIDSSTDEMFVQSYLQEMKDSGDPDFWIGLSDNNNNTGPWKWRNNHALGAYKNWFTGTHAPTNTKGRRDCVYMTTNDAAGRWRTTTSCQSAKAVVCRVAMNARVRPLPRTPTPHYGCPANWKLFGTTCYRLGDRNVNQPAARTRCQQLAPGSDLAVINSAGAQGFLNKIVRRGINYWIGLSDKTKNNAFVWNDGNTPPTYTNWHPGEPNDFGGGENCVVLNTGEWNDFPCEGNNAYICSLSAKSIVNPSTPVPTPIVDWTIKCGPGWESNPLTNYCYMFSDQQLAWTDAFLQCKNSGGYMLSITSVEEQNYLAGRLSGMMSVAVWTGANDRQTEGGWQWTSGDGFAYFNWAPGSPGGQSGSGTDCVAMLTNTAKWDDVRCDQRNGYICKKMGNVATTPFNYPMTMPPPADKKVGCRLGWAHWWPNCYAFIKRSGSWDDADTFCRSIGARLASINSRNEQNFVTGARPPSSSGNIWIGLNDKQIENRFQWTDGVAVAYTNWNTGEPNNWHNTNEDCVDMDIRGGKWFDENCASSKQGFLCKRLQELVPKNQSPPPYVIGCPPSGKWNDEICASSKQGFLCKRLQELVPKNQSPPPYVIGCPPGAYGYGSYCYKISTGDSRSWTSASAKCKSLHGSLATVNDRFTQSFLSSGLVRRTGNFWIGLSDKAKPGTYSWASGHNLVFTAWSQNHTGNEQSTCVAMSGRQPVGLWVNLDCTQYNNYICQLPRRGHTPPPTPGTPFPNVPCPQGWTTNYAYCIKMFSDKSLQKSWMDASGFCQALGGDLASFHAKGNDSSALSLIRGFPQGSMGVWIGLNARGTQSGYTWSDGSAVDYTNWNPGEPNNYQNVEDCAQMTPSGGWNDLNCYFRLPFICGVPRGTVPSTTLAPPVAVPSSQCGANPTTSGGGSWVYYNSSCYLVGSSSLSYFDAQAYCQNISSTLASVHTEQENGLLLSTIHTSPGDSFWIGLNKLDNRAYKWTDGSPVDYVSWGKGQPDDYSGSERCAEMNTWSGLWNDDLCSLQRGFICKKPLKGAAPIVIPSPNTPGGCPQGFLRADGGRNKCFYVAKDLRKTWKQAYTYCRSMGNKVDIASIEDDFETEFLITYAGRAGHTVWIGLNDHRGSNNFYWQDGSPVAYTNWDQNQPTSAKRLPGKRDTEDCVVARMYKGHEGKWADVPCNLNFSFICQVKQDPNLQKRPLPADGMCRPGYNVNNGRCYNAKATPKSWSDALADCKQDGGSLTSVAGIYELAFIGTLMTSAASPYWIGLTDTNSPGLFSWSDGSQVTFSRWSPGEPSYGQKNGNGCELSPGLFSWSDGSQVTYSRWSPGEPSYGQKNGNGCVLVDGAGYWNDSYCNGKHAYVCKLGNPAPTQPPASGSCPNKLWSGYGGSCYMASVNTGRSWPDSRFICQQSGMQLASIHSKAEMTFVLNLVKGAKVTNAQFMPDVWIGFSKTAKGSFSWTDGSATDFVTWAAGEPSKLGVHGELQECVTFDRKLGTWATTSCYSNRAFVCKTPKKYASTSPGSTLALVVGTGGTGSKSSNPQSQNQQPGSSPSGSGVSGGAIAGAVLGSILGVLLIAFLVVYLVRSGRLTLPAFGRGGSGAATGAERMKEEQNGISNDMFYDKDATDS